MNVNSSTIARAASAASHELSLSLRRDARKTQRFCTVMWDPRRTCKTICILTHFEQTTSNDTLPARTERCGAKPKKTRAPRTFAPTLPKQTRKSIAQMQPDRKPKVAISLREMNLLSRSERPTLSSPAQVPDPMVLGAKNLGEEFCAPIQKPVESDRL